MLKNSMLNFDPQIVLKVALTELARTQMRQNCQTGNLCCLNDMEGRLPHELLRGKVVSKGVHGVVVLHWDTSASQSG